MLKEISDRCLELDVAEQRSITDNYCELVFYTKDLDRWNNLLTDIFGQALKPEGAEPTGLDQDLAEEYGGIYANQTLFKKEFGDSVVIAMLWPWQDHLHTTVKIAVLKA